MNKHVNLLEPDGQPRHGEVAREEAFRDLPQAQIAAINCLIDIIDEPYTPASRAGRAGARPDHPISGHSSPQLECRKWHGKRTFEEAVLNMLVLSDIRPPGLAMPGGREDSGRRRDTESASLQSI
jgi:hypothetical protein